MARTKQRHQCGKKKQFDSRSRSQKKALQRQSGDERPRGPEQRPFKHKKKFIPSPNAEARVERGTVRSPDRNRPEAPRFEKRPPTGSSGGGGETPLSRKDIAGRLKEMASRARSAGSGPVPRGPGIEREFAPRRDAFKPRQEERFERSGPREDRKPDRKFGPKPEGRFKPGGRFPREHREEQTFAKGTKFKATVDKNRKGFGFLIFENRTVEDMFIPPREAEDLFHGDRVEVLVDPRGGFSKITVLAHRFRELVGRYTPNPAGPQKGGWILYEQKRAREEVWVPEPPTQKVQPNDWVRAELTFHEKGPFPVTGVILEVYGVDLPPSADVGMIAAEYNLIEEHSEASVKEAMGHRLEVPGKDMENRVDLRELPLITIDGETARDFDDAVYVEREGQNYVLWVGIADVSHYVKEGSALDAEARSRGTSVYFPERAFHMLPRALSENLCSLKPNEPRLAMVAKMLFDRQGQRLETEVMEAVIFSKRRATYNEIQEEAEENKDNKDWEFRPHFELYEIIKKARSDRGSIDFDLPEAEVVVKPTGEVISISQRPRKDSHRLIEEFMIAANEAVTHWMMDRAWPFVYRTHGEPAIAALERFEELAATVGVKVSIDDPNSSKVLAAVVAKLAGHPASALLNMALLRSMKQAVYSSTHDIHYGLASDGYTHFTSPIRRYPDLVVHRLIRWALGVEHGRIAALSMEERAKLERDLADICEHCSYRERIASDAERESIKLKQVRIMLDHLGEEFEGKIIGMIESGFFVKLNEPYVEGMVAKEFMMDDAYQFNEERMIFYGKRKKRTFKIGDTVTVKCARADVERRQIDFALVDPRAATVEKAARR